MYSDDIPDDIDRQAERLSDAGVCTYTEALDIILKKRGSTPARPELEVQREAEEKFRRGHRRD